jgi:hypothetical protein
LIFLASTAWLSARSDPAGALSPTFGWLDGVTIFGDGTLYVSGWSATSDSPTVALGVRVKIDGQLAIPNYRFSNEYRPDVGAAYPGYGNYHGFTFTVPAISGTHTVTIEAQNNGVYNDLSGPRTYTLGAAPLRRFVGGSHAVLVGTRQNYYWFRSGTTYDWQIDNAMVAWQATPTNLYVGRFTSTAGTQFDFYPQPYAQSWWGLTTIYPCPLQNYLTVAGCTYTYGNISLNTSTLGVESDDLKRKVVGHEAGHALGLAHPPSGSTSMMNQGCLGGLPLCPSGVVRDPAPYDTASFNTLYPLNSGDSP